MKSGPQDGYLLDNLVFLIGNCRLFPLTHVALGNRMKVGFILKMFLWKSML